MAETEDDEANTYESPYSIMSDALHDLEVYHFLWEPTEDFEFPMHTNTNRDGLTVRWQILQCIYLPTVPIKYQENRRRPDYKDKVRGEGVHYGLGDDHREVIVTVTGRDMHSYILNVDNIGAHIEALQIFETYLKSLGPPRRRG